MGFFLLVLVNAVLFVRPSELIPDLAAVPIYNILITCCLLTSIPALQRELSARSLAATPINLCVVGLQAAVALSHLAHFNLTYTKDISLDFLKVLLYYLLVVALLDTPERLRRFLTWLGVLIGMVALLSMLHYHGVIKIELMQVAERSEVDSTTGQVYKVLQLYGTGIFSDPNDLCAILMTGIGISLYKVDDRRSAIRWVWAVPLLGFAYTLFLTKSRGGFLAMLGCLMAAFMARFGWKRAIPVAGVVLPLMFVLFAGRQTDLSATTGTGQSRVQLWAMSLGQFRQSPFFGIGAHLLPDAIGAESHNSFVHCYAELGFFGGTLFLGMFLCALVGLIRLGRCQEEIGDPDLRRMRPYLVGIVAGYVTSIMSLSRPYINPTYLVPALVAAYFRLVAADASSPLPLPRVDARSVRRLVLASAGFVVLMSIYVRLFGRFG